jgi:SAM-dependent methyltransferase
VSSKVDPRERAAEKFAAPPAWPGLDLLSRCATDPPLAIATLLEAARPARDGAIVCEMGFGSGLLLEEMLGAFAGARLVGLDQSATHVEHARAALPDVRVIRGDMEALPFGDGALDVIVTCWTLYFMRDIDAALAGMRGCLRDGGRIVAATVAPDHMIEHEEMLTEAVRRATGRDHEPDIGVRFDLSNGGAYIERHFQDVELRRWEGVLTVPDIETAMLLWASYPPDGVAGDELAASREAYGELAEARLRTGPIVVRRRDGAFVGWKR